VRTAAYQPELIRLLLAALLEMRAQAEMIHRRSLGPIYQTMVDYLARCVARGSLRPLDPSITVVGLAATVLVRQRLSPVLTGTTAPGTEDAVCAYSNFWLGALLPAELNEIRPAFAHGQAAKFI